MSSESLIGIWPVAESIPIEPVTAEAKVIVSAPAAAFAASIASRSVHSVASQVPSPGRPSS